MFKLGALKNFQTINIFYPGIKFVSRGKLIELKINFDSFDTNETLVKTVDLIFLKGLESIEVKIGRLGSRSRTQFNFRLVMAKH